MFYHPAAMTVTDFSPMAMILELGRSVPSRRSTLPVCCCCATAVTTQTSKRRSAFITTSLSARRLRLKLRREAIFYLPYFGSSFATGTMIRLTLAPPFSRVLSENWILCRFSSATGSSTLRFAASASFTRWRTFCLVILFIFIGFFF